MTIEIRKTSPYVNVNVSEGNTKIDLGVLDKEEATQLITELQEAIDNLKRHMKIE